MENFDINIIGAGISGLTAAVYAARYNLKTLVISLEAGGTTATAHKICNFPSYYEISGFELMKKVLDQVEKLGVPINYEEVLEISKNQNQFEIKTNKSNYFSKKVLYAPGNIRTKLNIPGEKEFLGRGVCCRGLVVAAGDTDCCPSGWVVGSGWH